MRIEYFDAIAMFISVDLFVQVNRLHVVASQKFTFLLKVIKTELTNGQKYYDAQCESFVNQPPYQSFCMSKCL